MNEKQFAEIIAEKGGRLYRVGGQVRDEILIKLENAHLSHEEVEEKITRTVKDKDYCLVGFDRVSFLETFPKAQQVIGQNGEKTVDVFLLEIDGGKEEIALARQEVKVGEGYHGFEFMSEKTTTIQQDLYRRDLTINSIAQDVLTNEYVDPYGGIQDIQNKVLRATSDAFYEDPLRVYRVAVRYAKMSDFTVEERTKEMMKKASIELKDLKSERVVEELKKALLAKRPDLFFRLLQELDILKIHFPEVAALDGVIQPQQHHPEGDAFEHTMRTMVAMRNNDGSLEEIFCMLMHDVGKALTPKELLPKHHGHEQEGVPLVQTFCERLIVPKTWKKSALFATGKHGKFHKIGEMKAGKIVDLLNEADRTPIGVKGFAKVALADARGKANPDADHPYVTFALRAIEEMKKIKGNKELEGEKARDDKRSRQITVIKALKREMK